MKALVCTIFLICSLMSHGDIIVLKSGKTITCSDIELSDKSIYYKVKINKRESLKKISREEVFSVRIGSQDMIALDENKSISEKKDKTLKGSPTSASGILKAKPSNDNFDIINKYCQFTPIRSDKQKQNKRTDRGVVYWGIKNESIISTPNIEIIFEELPKYRDGEVFYHYEYKLGIRNKTDNIIYIDLGNCFQIELKESKPWYDGTVYNSGEEKSGGGSLGLGAVAGALGIGGIAGTLASGIGISSGSGKNAGTSYQMERIISIPPKSVAWLPPHKSVVDKKIQENYISLSMDGNPDFNGYKWDFKEFKEDDISFDYRKEFVIAYSLLPDFSTTYLATVSLYPRVIYGLPGIYPSRENKYFPKDYKGDKGDREGIPFFLRGHIRFKNN